MQRRHRKTSSDQSSRSSLNRSQERFAPNRVNNQPRRGAVTLWIILAGPAFLALLIFGAFCIIWGRYKTGLLVTYIYMFFTSFFDTRMHFVDMFDGSGIGLVIYMAVGMFASLMIFTSAFQQDN